GMSASETRESIALIERLAHERRLTLLFTEHDMEGVFSISHRITVLHQGKVIANGPPAEVRRDPEGRRVDLGEKHAGARASSASRASTPPTGSPRFYSASPSRWPAASACACSAGTGWARPPPCGASWA